MTDSYEIPPEAKEWEEFAQDPKNQNADCVRRANEMYKAMQKIQSRLMGLAQRDKAKRINAERENAESRRVLADGGGYVRQGPGDFR